MFLWYIFQCVSTPGKYLSHNILNLRQGSNLSSYLQLFTAFLASAFLHIVADYGLLRVWFGGGSLFFFTAQPFAIMLEDAVIALGKKMGVQPSPLWKLVGYAWVTVWFIQVFPGWFDPMVSGNFMDDGFNMPVSIILGLIKGQWNAKGTGSGRALVMGTTA
jgi:hypothetical protein